ncbi:MAG: ATP-binding protein, partial [Clostridia bacterium]
RYAGSGVYANAQLQNRVLREVCALAPDAQRLMQLAMTRYQLSMRGYYRVLKVARTIADLASADPIASEHLAEALQYRESAKGLEP